MSRNCEHPNFVCHLTAWKRATQAHPAAASVAGVNAQEGYLAGWRRRVVTAQTVGASTRRIEGTGRQVCTALLHKHSKSMFTRTAG